MMGSESAQALEVARLVPCAARCSCVNLGAIEGLQDQLGHA